VSEWDDLVDEVERSPWSKQSLALLHRAIDLADVAGADEDAFRLRMRVVRDASHVAEPVAALTAFAWCQARFDADPDRFAEHAWDLDWYRKWMPDKATAFPTVPLQRIVDMIDEVERRHVAAGMGRRQSLALRLDLQRFTGAGPGLAELLADWRASSRSSVSDCPACEAAQEASALRSLGRLDEAGAIVAPYIAGDRPFCIEGPGWLAAMSAEVLQEADLPLARRAFNQSLRECLGDPAGQHLAAHLASLAARSGSLDLALGIIRATVPLLPEAPSPQIQMLTCASLARALAAVAPGLPVGELTAGGVAQALGADSPVETAGELRDALLACADEHAARFAERDGTDVIAELLASITSAPDVADHPLEEPAAPRRTAARSGADQPGADGPSGSAGPVHDGPPTSAGDPSRRPPDDPVAFGDWARGRLAAWDSASVAAASSILLVDDEADPALRAAAASWCAGFGEVPDDVRALVYEPTIPTAIRAQLAIDLADHAPVEGDGPLLELASELLADDGGLTEEDRARLIPRLGSTLLHRGDVAAASELSSQAMTLHERVGLPAEGALRVQRLAFDLARAEVEQPGDLLPVARDVAEVSRPLLPTSWAAVALLDAAAVAVDAGASDEAARWATAADEAMVGFHEATSLRLRAALLLSDIAGSEGRFDDAISVQRSAVELARELGDFPLGWSRRGLGHLFRAVGRHDEAVVQYAEAADLLRRAGAVVEAAGLELDRAEVELGLREPDRAERLVAQVLESSAVDDDEGGRLRRRALELSARARAQRGDPRGAADRWIELAELEEEPGVAAWCRSVAAIEVARLGAEGADEVVALAGAAIEELERSDDAFQVPAVHERVGRAYATLGRFGDGSVHAGRARAAAEDLGLSALVVELRCFEADLLWDRDLLDDARTHLLATLPMLEEPDLSGLIRAVRGRLSGICTDLGRIDEADEHDRWLEQG
jgi:tetratricopeptide (TPR) repeat protein